MTCCLVTDVTKNISVLLVDGPEDFKDVVGYPTWSDLDWAYDLPGVVSRKKQLMPLLIRIVTYMEWKYSYYYIICRINYVDKSFITTNFVISTESPVSKCIKALSSENTVSMCQTTYWSGKNGWFCFFPNIILFV